MVVTPFLSHPLLPKYLPLCVAALFPQMSFAVQLIVRTKTYAWIQKKSNKFTPKNPVCIYSKLESNGEGYLWSV